MPRLVIPVVLLALSFLIAPVAVAQDASPVASPEATTGVQVEPLGLLEVAPGLAVPVVRITIAPGAALPPHSSPGPAVAQVVTGQVNYLLITGTATRARLRLLPPNSTPAAATPGAGTPVAEGTATAGTTDAFAVVENEVFVTGEETPLEPGQGVAFGPDVIHTFRNTGSEPAVLVLVGEFPPNEPALAFTQADAATPVATPSS